jgi:ureidoacrylate peracid hydrolase
MEIEGAKLEFVYYRIEEFHIMMDTLSREIPIIPRQSALLFIDVQNYNARPDGGEYKDKGLQPAEAEKKYDYFFKQLKESVIPNMQRLQNGCRKKHIEIIYTVIESLTKDGRDRSLDYKISGFNVPKASWDAEVLSEIWPMEDEIVIPKTSSSVFISTNIDFILRNLGVRFLIMSGLLTDQCISHAVRDACDHGYLVTLITDACATLSRERHDTALDHIKGYCRQRTTDEFLREIRQLSFV